MVSLGFGLAFVGAFALFATGWRLARADALEGWDVADIMLLRDERRRKRRIGPLDRAAKTLRPSSPSCSARASWRTSGAASTSPDARTA